MKFIKENLFLGVLVSVTIVLAAVLVVMERNYSAAAKKGAAARISLSRELSTLARGTHANQAAVDAEAGKVRLAREAVEEAKEGLIDRNRGIERERGIEGERGRYRVMTFVADGKTYSAFPIDRDLYAKVGAEYKIAQAYQDEVDALLKRLSPTEAPTSTEINAAIRPEEEPGLRAGPAPGIVPLDRRAVEDVGPTPEEIARDKFILSRALKGRIYANKDESMHMVLLSDQVRYSFEELWFAQVSLWVMGDIVEAVKATNERASSAGLGVPVSAIKRLVESEVLGYVVAQSRVVSGGSSARPSARGMAAPALDAAPASVDLQYYTGGARRASTRAPKLTGRACSQLHDVVHYRFTVVMVIKNLPRLCRDLLEQNNHTVIDVHISATDSEVRAASGGAERTIARGRGGDRSYYYGTDSVVQVTITGELQLLTDWARGRKKQVDPKTGVEVKGYPELMPKEFLSCLGALDAEALRPEDLERSGPPTGAPMMPGRGRSTFGRPPKGMSGPGGRGGFGGS